MPQQNMIESYFARMRNVSQFCRRMPMMFRKIPRLSSFVALVSLLPVIFSGPARCATAPMSTADLVQQSSDIIAATVVSTLSAWNDEKNFIFTTVTLRITNTYSGSMTESSVISVAVPGGEVDGVGLGVEHAAHFESGEQVIVFLRLLDDSVYGVTGWEMGKFTIEAERIKEKDVSLNEFEQEIKTAINR